MIRLERDMSDVIALDQAFFFLGKRQECHPNFLQSTAFVISVYTRVIGFTSGEVQHTLHLVHIKNRYVV